MSLIKKFGIFLIVLCILFSGLAFNFKTAQASSCTAWYQVQKGDTLAKIANKFGTTWQYLAKINGIKNPNKIYAGQTLCVSTTGGSQPPPKPVPQTIPTFIIYSVVRNQEVTIYTHNFPPNMKFNVYMGPMHTKGIGGYSVGSFNSGKGGSFYAGPFAIPSALKGSSRIAIRAENSWSGYYAYNWFYNNTAVDP